MIDLSDEIDELRGFHRDFKRVEQKEHETVIRGLLAFEASGKGLEAILDCFDVELRIPQGYPKRLPVVLEKAGKILKDYDHVNAGGTLCLGTPIEERRIFLQQPTLLGFVNNLVVPFLYGYCYSKKHGEHPFGEQKHGAEGILQHYVEVLGLDSKDVAASVVCYLYEHGYRGHHPCPCGSGRVVRECHGTVLWDLLQLHTPETLRQELEAALCYCVDRKNAGELTVELPLGRRIRKLVGKRDRRSRRRNIR